MKRLLLIIMVLIIYVLHQDFWFWRTVQPLVLGFLPIGLFYHICYTLAVAGVMWVLVKQAWPSRLELETEVEAQNSSPRSKTGQSERDRLQPEGRS